MMRRIWFVVLPVVLAGSSAWAMVGGGDIKFPATGMSPVVYSHDEHVVKAKLRCTECHYQIYTNHAQHKPVGMDGMRQGRSCGACHNGTRAFSVSSPTHCAKCHK